MIPLVGAAICRPYITTAPSFFLGHPERSAESTESKDPSPMPPQAFSWEKVSKIFEF